MYSVEMTTTPQKNIASIEATSPSPLFMFTQAAQDIARKIDQMTEDDFAENVYAKSPPSDEDEFVDLMNLEFDRLEEIYDNEEDRINQEEAYIQQYHWTQMHEDPIAPTREDLDKEDLDQWWVEEGRKHIYVKKPVTEEEMDRAYREFIQLVQADLEKERKRLEDHYHMIEDAICRWFESHPTSKIPVNASHEEQYQVYLKEVDFEQKQIDKRRALEAKINREEKQKAITKLGRTKGKKRANAKVTINNQQKRKKEHEKKKAAEKKKEIEDEKEAGLYKGKRVKRKERQATVKVEVRPIPVVKPIDLGDSGDEDEDEDEETPLHLYLPIKSQIIGTPENGESVEDSDDEFANAMMEVKNGTRRSLPKKSVPKKNVQRKSVPQKFHLATSYRDSKKGQFSSGMNMLVDKKVQEKVLYKTKMCNSIGPDGKQKYRCRHGKNCRFAHTKSELSVRTCRFGESCRLVKRGPRGCVNHASRTGKICKFYHPEMESKSQYNMRVGNVDKKDTPISLPIPSTQPKTKTRWGPCVTKTEESVTHITRKTRWGSKTEKTVTRTHKTRWGPAHVWGPKRHIITLPENKIPQVIKYLKSQGVDINAVCFQTKY